jgi:hypothetical protein
MSQDADSRDLVVTRVLRAGARTSATDQRRPSAHAQASTLSSLTTEFTPGADHAAP